MTVNLHQVTLLNLAVVCVTASIAFSPSLPAAADTSKCSPSSSDCVGWAGFAGENPLVAAIRSELGVNHIDRATRFYGRIQKRLAERDARAVSAALRTARTSGSAAAVAALTADLSPYTIEAVPPQQTHGETKAMSYYSWYLHGSNSVRIYYGSCSSYTASCTTGGWWNMDNTANTYFPTDGAYFTEDALKGGGVDARIIDHKVRLLQDVTGATDPTKATLPCTTSTAYGSGPHCSVYSNPAMTTGNWYYFQIDFVDQPVGYPNSSFQIQTRRWQVINSTNWQFAAYATGG